MQYYPIYKPQSPDMMRQFLQQSPWCLLLTQDEACAPVTGMFNPLVEDTEIYLHLHRQDPQLKQLQKNPEAHLVFTSYHGYVPSYAKDPEDASFATMFYRFAQLQIRVTAVTDIKESAAILDRMMQRYQPEGGYQPLSGREEEYGPSLRMIQVLRCSVLAVQGKWKLGQNRTAEEQLRAHSFIRR